MMYVVAYFGSALIATFLTPVVSRLAKRLGLLDKPGPRKVHKSPVARVGGIVFVMGTLLMVAPVLFMARTVGDPFGGIQTQLIALLACGLLVYGIGLVDDLRSLPAALKLLGLIGAALVMCSLGARIELVELAGVFRVDFGWTSWPITVLWITGITVSMNFIDGLDGLAAGIAVIVCGATAFLAYQSGLATMVILMLSLLGSLTGFLFFNFSPAKIFMGDGGAMYLGFLIGAGSVVCQAKTATLVGVALPALALGVPLADALLTLVRRRVLDRRSMFSGERGHIHHCLLEKGFGQRTAVFLIYGVTLVAGGMGVLMLAVHQGGRLAVLAAGVLFICAVFQLAGTARIRETLAAVIRNREIARQEKEERGVFEDAQLMVREATSFDQWWKAICYLAERTHFNGLALSLCDEEGSPGTVVWQRSGEDPSPCGVTNTTTVLRQPTSDHALALEVAFGRNGSLEAGGRRLWLLSRLLDERRIPLRPQSPRYRQPTIRIPVSPLPGPHSPKAGPPKERREAVSELSGPAEATGSDAEARGERNRHDIGSRV